MTPSGSGSRGSNGDYNNFLQGTLKVGLDVVQNGSFEQPTAIAPTFDTLTGEQLDGWVIEQGNVDLISPGYWNASEGAQSVDLDGLSPGAISQAVSTVPGQRYDLTFDYSANPETERPDTIDGRSRRRRGARDLHG